MDITAIGILAFSVLYLLILPGLNLLRTMKMLKNLEIEEIIMLSFGLSLLVLIFIAIVLSLPKSIGLNFHTLIIFMALFMIFTNMEVMDCTKRALRRLIC
ncbi:MAG: hypothetical protein BME93_04175 [Methanosarcinales archaeon Met12]|nr:MAG: hypothetical protein BME93_04175 [Methanosarcinales archaeon Met12]